VCYRWLGNICFHIMPGIGIRLGYDDLTLIPFSKLKWNDVSSGSGRRKEKIWLEMYWFFSIPFLDIFVSLWYKNQHLSIQF